MFKLGTVCLAIFLFHKTIVESAELEPYCKSFNNTVFYQHNCYVFQMKKVNYATAKQLCENEHTGFVSHLAFFQTQDVLDYIDENRPANFKYGWTGLVLRNSSDPQLNHDWVWKSGEKVWPAFGINWLQVVKIVADRAGLFLLHYKKMYDRYVTFYHDYICQIEDPENRMYRRTKNVRVKHFFAERQATDAKECANECKSESGCIGFSVNKDVGFCMLASYSTEKKELVKRDHAFDTYDRA